MKTEPDPKILYNDLAARIKGEVHVDLLRRYLLSTDASIFKLTPSAVVYPETTADVQHVVRFAARHGLQVHPRGAGSGLCGSAVGNGLVVDFSKFMNRLLQVDLDAGWFECQPGFRLGELERVLKGSGLFFPPDPSSGEYATFGGMCSTNASGAHSVKYGNAADYLLDAEVVLADGTRETLARWASMPLTALPEKLQQLATLYRDNAGAIETAYPPIACNVAGYNLRGLVADERLRLHRLMAGSEGSLAVVTRLKFRIIRKPAADALVVAYFDDMVTAARAVQLIMPLNPSGIEIMDKSLLDLARSSDAALKERIPGGVDNVLLVEFDGPSVDACVRSAADAQAQLRHAQLAHQAYLASSAGEKARFWAVRKAAVPILYKLKGSKKILALVEDAAVPVDQLVSYVQGLYDLFHRREVAFVLYGHIAKGLMHTRPLLDLKDGRDVALLRPLADEVYELVERLGGTVSGEHGDGRLRSAYLQRRYPAIYPLFLKAKHLLDPQGILNPEIKSSDDPDQMTRHLRFGTQYSAAFGKKRELLWPEALEQEAEKCHGCSKCTTITTATRMCPVYKFTRDEAAAPKAKANALRGLISGALDERALYAKGFQQVMALCVNCGSCSAECPSNVDIPKLAIEAKAQFVKRFGASMADRLTANVESAARWTHRFSDLIAPVVRKPAVRRIAAQLTGLAGQRELVRFRRRSLYQQLPDTIPGKGPRVLYYAGCYAGYIRPELGVAAVEVLKCMGFAVHIPPQHCCGLPHLSKGMTGAARRFVSRNLETWGALIQRADYLAVTCSSCGFALMKDWGDLLEEKPLADSINAKTVHISWLLHRYRERMKLNALPIAVAYHHPCHLRIQPHRDSSLDLLSAIPGLELHDLNSHCCGIAGSWGMLARNYPLSKAIGSSMARRLASSGATMGITDCPTCQMQMEHLGRLPVRHPVEIVYKSLIEPAQPSRHA